MCGIFGYIGLHDARKEIIKGLQRLEYRGYDSWGVAIVEKNSIQVFKKVGAIGNFEDIAKLPIANIGIGHTRWATHGGVTENNAHPHFSTKLDFIVAQNGIVENYQQLKIELTKLGYQFTTQTDTEIIVRLIESKIDIEKLSLRDAVRSAFLDLKGRNTIIILEKSGKHIFAVRNGSPLVIGVGENEIFIASDTLSFTDRTNNVIFIDNNEMVECENNQVRLFNVLNNKQLDVKSQMLDQNNQSIDLEGYEHFMIKEIEEQKHTILSAINYSQEELHDFLEVLRKARRIFTVGAGTAGFAAGQIAYYLRKYAKLDTQDLKSYEMGSYSDLFCESDILIAISQSGETADTIEAIETFQRKGGRVASLVNMLGSSITRMSDYVYYTRSGPEMCVASTKAFTAQVAWGLLVTFSLLNKANDIEKIISQLSQELNSYFSPTLTNEIKRIVAKIEKQEHFFVLGRDQNYIVALEGALKVKEITYKHFEGFAAGELKHGVIALVEQSTSVFVIIDEDEYKNDMLSAVAEVKARGAFVIAVAKENNELFDEFIPSLEASYANPIANIIPFQLISYHLGVKLGNSPDKPRNLAKSVTVK